MSETLKSEDVIINAPMSFAGAWQRSMRLRRGHEGINLWLVTAAVVLLIPTLWLLVLAWYIVFGLFLLPYRLLRRGARKRKAEALRHREILASMERKPTDTTPT